MINKKVINKKVINKKKMNTFPTYEDLQEYICDAHGLTNTGNKCYFNSMIQVLISCPLFIKLMKKYNQSLIAKEFVELSNGSKGAISNIYQQMRQYGGGSLVEGNSQEDAHEALHIFLDVIDKCDKQLYTNLYNCLFHRIYQAIKCVKCGHVSETKYEDLVFHFDSKCKSLHEYIYDEVVEYKCEKCSPDVNVNHTKSQRIARLGPVLLIAFKQYKDKLPISISKKFEFEGVSDNLLHTYELIGQIQHSGSMSGGHYVAICRRSTGVYMLNDASTSQMPDFAIDANTYILAYEYMYTTEKPPSTAQRS